MGFSFETPAIDRIDSQSDFQITHGNSGAVMQKLHRGDKRALNIYIARPSYAGGWLGWSSFPWDVASSTTEDGIIIDYTALPGMSTHSSGHLAIHETGHWLGLFHTFENGCNLPGDSVNDTASEAAPNVQCPTTPLSSCPSAGVDPIHNFMDYTNDSCTTSFTSGQANRVHNLWLTYRR